MSAMSGLPFRQIFWAVVSSWLRFRYPAGMLFVFAAAAWVGIAAVNDWKGRSLDAIGGKKTRLQVELDALRQYSQVNGTGFVGPASLISAFPQESELPLLSQLKQMTESHRLGWTSARYAKTPLLDSRIVRLDIELPLSGAYVDIQNFLADCLNSSGNIALRQLVLRRAESGNAVEATIHLSVFFRSK